MTRGRVKCTVDPDFGRTLTLPSLRVSLRSAPIGGRCEAQIGLSVCRESTLPIGDCIRTGLRSPNMSYDEAE
ncbi:hypothetical protein PHSY_007472 [Pseudozyma hubeiensis SY62]|uniref:Uncharacterized protein n=1 Tax=Pseudozyma hubeiensis (strain SY62) TaxID=1305764 RepID=R9PES8_PSEHS|nr:hypothetical protein PHSY_007472 [Pseudozyma hubeiensis SY62]GAC99869.1 hypothetical protein PHSY_007472 [Pseudozyma hubeiensis SY62]